jgi:Mrp family chromosome partitioning ATPase
MMMDTKSTENMGPALDQDGTPVPPAPLSSVPVSSAPLSSVPVSSVPVPWQPAPPALGQVLTVDSRLMRDLASRAISAGRAGLTKVGVASIQHGEGATTIARSLAACLGENFGKRVILVEANHRSPCLRRICGLPPGAGFFEVLSGAASLESSLRMSRAAGKMLVLPASDGGFEAGSRFAPAFDTLLAELLFYAEAIVFDLPPLLRYADAAIMGRALDGVAVVMRAGQTTRRDSTQAVESLTGAGANVLGAILNRTKTT